MSSSVFVECVLLFRFRFMFHTLNWKIDVVSLLVRTPYTRIRNHISILITILKRGKLVEMADFRTIFMLCHKCKPMSQLTCV